VNTLPHDTVYVFLHNLLNVLVQIADNMGLQKKTFHIRRHYATRPTVAASSPDWTIGSSMDPRADLDAVPGT
jgi:hypothetical protein